MRNRMENDASQVLGPTSLICVGHFLVCVRLQFLVFPSIGFRRNEEIYSRAVCPNSD